MPFQKQEFQATKGIKIQYFMINSLKISQRNTQKYLAKGRVFDSTQKAYKNNQIIYEDKIYIFLFVPTTRNLFPIYQNDDFAIFDKPSFLMIHPVSRSSGYCLLDEVRHQFGNDANLVHRLDRETSGLVVASKHKESERELKTMFEQRLYEKKYLALVDGHIKESLTINKAIAKDKNSSIGIKMTTLLDGKNSTTIIKPLKYIKSKNQTFIQALPKTGRQHQIRVHLNSISHRIIGDPIYGIDEKIANLHLLKELSKESRLKYTKENRLMLHGFCLSFAYKNIEYKFYSKQKFIKREYFYG